ncbi:mCG146039, partial [Mus musculus]
ELNLDPGEEQAVLSTSEPRLQLLSDYQPGIRLLTSVQVILHEEERPSLECGEVSREDFMAFHKFLLASETAK